MLYGRKTSKSCCDQRNCDCGDTLILKEKSFCTKYSQSQIQKPYIRKQQLQLMQKIQQKDLCSLLQLYHFHPNNQFENFILDQQEQIILCSILNLFFKHKVFFSRFQKNDLNQISNLFYELHVDENFKTYLSQQILIHFNHLYNPIQIFKLITIDNYQSKLDEIFQKLPLDINIKKNFCKNKIEKAYLFSYFFQLTGHLVLGLLRLYKENKNPQIYQFFDIFSNQLLYLPLCNSETKLYCSIFNGELNESEKPQIQHAIKKFLINIYLNQNISLKGNLNSTFHFLKSQEQDKFYVSLVIQISILSGYRKFLPILVNVWIDVYKQNKVGLQNIFRLIINNFLNNYAMTYFKLKKDTQITNYLSNIFICDKNFITLMDQNDSQETYTDLLETSGLTPEKFRDIMFNY
ncbi:unnamed protein product [Paramecium sonneborni]|uniref:Uncharacterized protein n=1 Tax=Paramecium sonneborni TaxID=65129 RepID=A0A8S1RGW0_9CILI|nr:unnamed protein product [Paramecium sonneborni]